MNLTVEGYSVDEKIKENQSVVIACALIGPDHGLVWQPCELYFH